MDTTPAQTDSLTPSQRQAIHARGNVLVMAGAGTGKTKTLVERCLDCLERNGAQIDELLIVTFTEAAAAEMRQRLRKAIEEKAAANPLITHPLPLSFWPEQLARFDLAHIGTLHSFCLKLVREHFFELGLDPRLAILDEAESRQLANEILDAQFTAHYEGQKAFSPAVLDLIQVHGEGRDENIRKLILRLHNYSQARPDAGGWLAKQRGQFSGPTSADWQKWLFAGIADWRNQWLPVLENIRSGNEKAAELADGLSNIPANFPRATAALFLDKILAADVNWPAKRKTLLRKPLENFFDEARFLHSLAAVKNGADPLAEDWGWVRGQMETLLQLAEEFAALLTAKKRADGALDFHDLEQFALKLLWDLSTGQPTAVAQGWRGKLKLVFVDEYQDINAAQDKIIQGLSRDGWWNENHNGPLLPATHGNSRGCSPHHANRFLVGDVKQSIYRFRLADPQIFRDYALQWHGDTGQTIPLSENFRSHEALLDFVNSVFRIIMRLEIGGVAYDQEAELKPGMATVTARNGTRTAGQVPRAELLVRFKASRNVGSEDEDNGLPGLDDAQREARLVVWRLKQLFASRHEIFDDKAKVFRPVEWRDIAILLRSPQGRSEIYAKEFEHAGVPLAVARGGFYKSAEILDMVSLLQLLDNPLQDVPCIAVLRSPFVGLSLDELAEIRLAAKEKHFWTALNHWEKSEIRKQKTEATLATVSIFLKRFSHWRKLAKQVSLSQCLEEILAETLYADWLRGQSRGGQRAGNLAGFLDLARQFDQFQRQGLFRFLKFIEAQQDAGVEPEVPVVDTENAVRLMSIHQSKGLEFPVVVLADLAKQFNEQDLREDILFDEQFGLCPKIKPPNAGGRYPSLPHWLAQRRQKRELRGEEMRLLYVALTRARDNLFLTASVTASDWEKKWSDPQPSTVQAIGGARSFADWLAIWFSGRASAGRGKTSGECENLHWQIVEDSVDSSRGDEAQIESGRRKSQNGNHLLPQDIGMAALRERLEWSYPFGAASRWKAKSSVTALRREADALDDESEQIFRPEISKRRLTGTPASQKSTLSAAEVGVAHHKFLQQVALDTTDDLAAEADRLVREHFLSTEERNVLDLAALADFWLSPHGRAIAAHAPEVRRELPFTARFSPQEIAAITGRTLEQGLENEFVVVQGVADLAVILPEEIWLVDFKTDDVSQNDFADKVKTYTPQLRLYAAALEKIFGRKVTRRTVHFLVARRTAEI